MTLCHIDVETFSRANLLKVAAHQYARDPSTELLLCAYQFDDDVPDFGDTGPRGGPVALWDAMLDPMPADLREAFADPGVTFAAFNANFEIAIFEHCLGIAFAPERWTCVQALALSWGFPASLAGVGDAMELTGDHAKDKRGKKLIERFSLPQKDGRRIWPHEFPDEWAAFGEYCRRDVVAECEIFRRLGT